MTRSAVRVRVLGPYPNGVNYRLVVIDGARRKSVTAPTLAQAETLKQRFESEIKSQRTFTIGEALEEYIAHRVHDRGVLPVTVSEIRRLTQDFLSASAPLAAITPDEAKRLYAVLSERH